MALERIPRAAVQQAWHVIEARGRDGVESDVAHQMERNAGYKSAGFPQEGESLSGLVAGAWSRPRGRWPSSTRVRPQEPHDRAWRSRARGLQLRSVRGRSTRARGAAAVAIEPRSRRRYQQPGRRRLVGSAWFDPLPARCQSGSPVRAPLSDTAPCPHGSYFIWCLLCPDTGVAYVVKPDSHHLGELSWRP